MLAEWLTSAEVSAWWKGPEHQLDLLIQDLDDPAMTQLIVIMDDMPVAYAQHHDAHQWHAPHLADLPEGAIALDVFSAPTGFGKGSRWLQALGDLLLHHAGTLAVDSAPQNLRAIRAYRKAGFFGDQVRLDTDGHPARVMTRLR